MKKSVVFALSAIAALVLKADVMNWQVADDSLSDCDYARLYYVNGNTTVGGTPLASTELDEGRGDARQIDLTAAGVSSSGTYFYIEAGNYKGDVFTATKVAGAYSYTDLVSAGLISSGTYDAPSGNSFGQAGVTIPNVGPVTYGAVPEPGTATLILLGMAIAGLKRRRV